MTTFDKKANKLSIQNNGIHQERGRHTCLALRTMPYCLFIRCQKSLCLFGDSDSNLILFHFFFFGKVGAEALGRRERERGEEEGGKSDSHIFSSGWCTVSSLSS